jgi:hypothetical protein
MNRIRHSLTRLMLNARHVAGVMIAVLLLITLQGCASEVTTTTASITRPLPPDPRPAPVTPASAQPTRMVFAVGSKPDDTDGNSFPDRIDATVMLFAPPHPSPVFVDGTFELALFASGTSGQPNVKPIAQWTISGEALERAKHHTTIGPQYRLALSLLDVGTDQYTLALADLTCTFIPAPGTGGTPVTSDGVRSIQIGRAAAVNR